MIQVKLLAFAQAAVELGWREMLVECAPGETPREVFERVAPGFKPGAARVAADCEYQSWDDAIGPMTQELAVIPPVSGG
jgi:molybdopterin synthase sulfur carrier subunit